MSTFASPAPIAIGDLQGCLDPLLELLDAIERDAPGRPLWFCGDLVNRGPQSLETLRFVRDLGDRAVSVLGNHDLHLLAVAHGIRRAHRNDTLDPILTAPDRDALLEWLRHRPLAHHAHAHLLVHAGVMPAWRVADTLALAAEVEAGLRGADVRGFLSTMYGNEPARWSDALEGADRRRLVINALTRMRFLTRDGAIDFSHKEGADNAPDALVPWFDAPDRRTHDTTMVFGHWSALGLRLRDNLVALDTGCVWGGALTAVELAPKGAARRRWQAACGSRVPVRGPMRDA